MLGGANRPLEGAIRWADVEMQQPRLAELGRLKLGGPGVVLVGTIRRDGSPRLSPVEPLFWQGDLWLSMGWESRKAGDLTREVDGEPEFHGHPATHIPNKVLRALRERGDISAAEFGKLRKQQL